ncbi:MAG: hypothetical protein EHM47_02395 [Ignavibacteriales bacterium]|nr:MAG: hypothetical protein EHM47_02395 [Ignavibacteriales bacterium]
MKPLILFFAMFLPVLLFAQNEVVTEDKTVTVIDDQTREWMNKISSDSDLRSHMMNMMIEQTKDNEEEMTKLVNTITADAELNKMIMNRMSNRAHGESTIHPRETMSDTVKMMQMKQVKPMQRK